MGGRMETRLGDAMGVIERIGRAIALGETELSPYDVALEADRLFTTESPWLAGDGVGRVVDLVTGMGPIQPLLDDPDVSDVLVNGRDDVWVDRGMGLEKTDVGFDSYEEIVNTVFATIVESLRTGRKIELRGFGSFRIRDRGARIGRNPKTGERVEVPPKRIPYFKPGKELKEQLNRQVP